MIVSQFVEKRHPTLTLKCYMEDQLQDTTPVNQVVGDVLPWSNGRRLHFRSKRTLIELTRTCRRIKSYEVPKGKYYKGQKLPRTVPITNLIMDHIIGFAYGLMDSSEHTERANRAAQENERNVRQRQS